MVIFIIANFVTTLIYSIFLKVNGIFSKDYLAKKEQKYLIVSLLLSSVCSLYFAIIPTNKYILSKYKQPILDENIDFNSVYSVDCKELSNEQSILTEVNDTRKNKNKITSTRPIEAEKPVDIKHLLIIITAFAYAILITPILYIGTAFNLTGNPIAPPAILIMTGLLTCLFVILTPFSIIYGLKNNNRKYYLQYPALTFVFIFIPFGGIIFGILILMSYLKTKINQ